MKTELDYLKNEENKIKWEKIFDEIESKIKEYELKIDNLDSIQVDNEEEKNDYMDPDAKVDLNELNVEQAMKRGDAIQDADDDAIDNRNEDTLVPAIYSWRRYQIGWGHIARLVKRPKRLLQNAIHLVEAECAEEETTSQRDKANVTNPRSAIRIA